MDDKQFVEVQYPAGARVTIHYRLIRDNDTDESFKSEPMKNMYQGIFVKEFLLFYGETLEYYLTVELPDDTRQTDKETSDDGRVLTGGKYEVPADQSDAGRSETRTE